MPFWCGYWGSPWWIFPLLGLVVMGVTVFACVRGGFACMGRRDAERAPGHVAELRREIEALKEEVRKPVRNPS